MMTSLRTQGITHYTHIAPNAAFRAVFDSRPSLEFDGARVRGIISRLVAVYRIPSVHPLASLVPVSGSKTVDREA